MEKLPQRVAGQRFLKSKKKLVTPNETDLMKMQLSQMKRVAGYLARQERECILTQIEGDPKRLEPYGYKVYSQNDEDGILAEIFRRLGIMQGRFCEIGVESGLECNTLYLIHQGWRGIWFEGDEQQKGPIEQKFHSLFENGRLRLVMGYLTAEIVDRVFTQLGFGTEAELDFLSIDIDGNDIYLFEQLSVRPKVVCIEYNAKFPPPLHKQPVYDKANQWRGGDYMGSSLSALDALAKRKGYTLVATNLTGANAFFVRNDLVADKFVTDSSPANLYNPPRYWMTFDLFSSIGHRADFGPYTDLE